MSSVISSIHARASIRAYSNRSVEEDKRKQLSDFMSQVTHGPFGNSVRFQFVEIPHDNIRELRRLGTYGMIRGSTLYLAGAVCRGEMAMEDYGYCMESIVIKATELGLGTCWLGGSLNRSSFASRMALSETEVIPAVSPLGYAGERSSPLVAALGMSRGNRQRKDPRELFFEGDMQHSLDLTAAGPFGSVLDCVRVAPSASNRQPWRVIKDANRDAFHFFLKENKVYNNSFGDIRIQNIDMGIAMCHFVLAARELSLAGQLAVEEQKPESGNLLYVASWIGR